MPKYQKIKTTSKVNTRLVNDYISKSKGELVWFKNKKKLSINQQVAYNKIYNRNRYVNSKRYQNIQENYRKAYVPSKRLKAFGWLNNIEMRGRKLDLEKMYLNDGGQILGNLRLDYVLKWYDQLKSFKNHKLWVRAVAVSLSARGSKDKLVQANALKFINLLAILNHHYLKDNLSAINLYSDQVYLNNSVNHKYILNSVGYSLFFQEKLSELILPLDLDLTLTDIPKSIRKRVYTHMLNEFEGKDLKGFLHYGKFPKKFWNNFELGIEIDVIVAYHYV